MDSLIRNLRVLWRADSIIADIRFRHVLLRSGLNAFGALVALLGLLILEFSLYLSLTEPWGASRAALAIGAGNVVLGLVLFAIATRCKPGREMELAMEVHKSAIEALQADARSLSADLSALSTIVKHPLDAALPGMIVPLINIVLKSLKKPKESGASG